MIIDLPSLFYKHLSTKQIHDGEGGFGCLVSRINQHLETGGDIFDEVELVLSGIISSYLCEQTVHFANNFSPELLATAPEYQKIVSDRTFEAVTQVYKDRVFVQSYGLKLYDQSYRKFWHPSNNIRITDRSIQNGTGFYIKQLGEVDLESASKALELLRKLWMSDYCTPGLIVEDEQIRKTYNLRNEWIHYQNIPATIRSLCGSSPVERMLGHHITRACILYHMYLVCASANLMNAMMAFCQQEVNELTFQRRKTWATLGLPQPDASAPEIYEKKPEPSTLFGKFVSRVQSKLPQRPQLELTLQQEAVLYANRLAQRKRQRVFESMPVEEVEDNRPSTKDLEELELLKAIRLQTNPRMIYDHNHWRERLSDEFPKRK